MSKLKESIRFLKGIPLPIGLILFSAWSLVGSQFPTATAFAQLGGPSEISSSSSPQAVEVFGSVVRGRVSGQAPKGNYLGAVSGATVEFLTEAGSSIATATADKSGFYEIGGLLPGKYIYKVTGSGYAPDDEGRGFQLPQESDGFVVDFVLTRGRVKPSQTGALSGQVQMKQGEIATPMQGVKLTAKRSSDRHYEIAYTEADGAYSFTLSPGQWQLSASQIGMEPQIYQGNISISANSTSTADFNFSEVNLTIPPPAKDVFAQVNVPAEIGEAIPEVRFVNSSSGNAEPGTVTKISDEELKARGIAAFFSKDNPVIWYEALPSNPLPSGNYFAEAELAGLPAVQSLKKEVTSKEETWFDIALNMAPPSAEQGEGETAGKEPTATPVMPGLIGRVTGQNESGDYLGIVEGAIIEVIGDDGEVVGTATSNDTGYYEISELGAGAWTYRVNSPEYSSFDTGHGFLLEEDSEMQILDIVLSQSDPSSPEQGTIRGHVWREVSGKKQPIAGASISLKPNSHETITTLTTDSTGAYEVKVPPAQWSASALSDDFQREISPDPVELASGGEATIDFTFSQANVSGPALVNEVYAVISVEQEAEGTSSPPPTIEFISETGAPSIPGVVTRLQGHDLGLIGGDSAAAAANLTWFESTPSQALSVGDWRVRGELPNYDAERTEPKTVRDKTSTYYDLNLTLEGEVAPPPPPPAGYSRVIGRVKGQTSDGDYEGDLAGARVDLFSKNGSLVGSTHTNASGFYEIEKLNSGEHYYRVSKAPYEPDDTGRGFFLPAEHQGYVVDFILTRPVSKPGQGTLSGFVWVEEDGVKIPTKNAQVAVVNQTTQKSQLARTDRNGAYEFFLPTGSYHISAAESRLGQIQGNETAVSIADNAKESVDFVFEINAPIPGPENPTPPALPGLLTGVVSVVDGDGKFPEPGAQVLALDETTSLVGGIGYTNEEGSYSINLPPGSWKVSAAVENLGEQISEQIIAITAGSKKKTDFTFEIPLPEIGEIFGHVWVDKGEEEMTPFQNATVAVMNSLGEIVETTTDDEGMYSFALRPENWKIAASSQELHFNSVHPEIIALQGAGEERVDFVMEPPMPEMAEVYLVLAVERSQAEAGAHPTIELLHIPGPAAQPTLVPLVVEPLGARPEDSDFFQSLGLTVEKANPDQWQYYAAAPELGGVAPGLYLARAGMDRYVSVEVEAQSAHVGLPTLFELEILKVRPEILAEVVCTEGEPVTNASVSFVNKTLGQSLGESPKVTTNDKGIASHILQSGFGSFNVIVHAEGFQPLIRDAEVEESRVVVKAELLRWPEINVTVNDKEGKPIPGVDLKFVNHTLGKSLNEAVQSKTDPQGVGFVTLEDGFANYNLVASHSDYQPHAQELKVNQEYASINIRMFKTGQSRTMDFSAVVVENVNPTNVSVGNPETTTTPTPDNFKRIPNAKVAFHASHGKTLPTSLQNPLITNSNGELSAPEVEEGTYTVSVAAEGYEVFTGSVAVAFGAEPPVLALDARPVALENWIRMILTQGWGKPSARQFHQNGLREDPQDCKVNYAFGLSSLRGEDKTNAVNAYHQAVAQVHKEKWWDRSCEGYIWTLMYYNSGQTAASEIHRLVANFYSNRTATPESQDAVRMFGIAMGVLNGPWNTNATSQSYAQIDQQVSASLQEPLRTAYLTGRNGVFNNFNDLTRAGNEAKQKAMDAALQAKKNLETKNGARILEIQKLLRTYGTQQQAITGQWTTYEAGANNNYNKYAAELQQIMLKIQNIRLQIAQLNQQPQQPTQMQPVVCQGCAADGLSFDPQCEYCQAATQHAHNQMVTPTGQNNAAIQGRVLLLGRQLRALEGQANQYQALIAELEGQFNQAQVQYNQQIGVVNREINTLNAELRKLQGEMASAPDPAKEAANAGKQFDQSKASFITYSKYLIEQRRQELLDYINRKTELPNPNAVPMNQQQLNPKISPTMPIAR